MTISESVRIVGQLALAFPVPAWSKEQILFFAEKISDLDLAKAQKEVDRWINVCDERPTIASFRNCVKPRFCC